MGYAPCKNCEKRYVGCHSKCDEYKRFKDEHDYAKNNQQAFYRSYYPDQRFFDEMIRRNRRNKKNK